jgi:hypothetical protein
MLTDRDDDIAMTAWALRRLAAMLAVAGVVMGGIAIVVLWP